MIFFVDGAISVEVQWKTDSARCKALIASLTDAHFQALEQNDGLVHAQEILWLWVDTDDMTIGLPQMKLEDLRQR